MASSSKQRKPSKQGPVLLIWGVPKNLKARFKAKCARKGVTMRDTVLGFLRSFVSSA